MAPVRILATRLTETGNSRVRVGVNVRSLNPLTKTTECRRSCASLCLIIHKHSNLRSFSPPRAFFSPSSHHFWWSGHPRCASISITSSSLCLSKSSRLAVFFIYLSFFPTKRLFYANAAHYFASIALHGQRKRWEKKEKENSLCSIYGVFILLLTLGCVFANTRSTQSVWCT